MDEIGMSSQPAVIDAAVGQNQSALVAGNAVEFRVRYRQGLQRPVAGMENVNSQRGGKNQFQGAAPLSTL